MVYKVTEYCPSYTLSQGITWQGLNHPRAHALTGLDNNHDIFVFRKTRELNYWVGLIWLREDVLVHGELHISVLGLIWLREGDLVQGESQIALPAEPNQPNLDLNHTSLGFHCFCFYCQDFVLGHHPFPQASEQRSLAGWLCALIVSQIKLPNQPAPGARSKSACRSPNQPARVQISQYSFKMLCNSPVFLCQGVILNYISEFWICII